MLLRPVWFALTLTLLLAPPRLRLEQRPVGRTLLV